MMTVFVFLSKDDVGSSNNKIFLSCNNDLNMTIICFCPPDNLFPSFPTLLSNPFGNLSKNERNHIFFKNFFVASIS